MKNRIPAVKDDSLEAMQIWFNEMEEKGLCFHPDDDPREIVTCGGSVGVFNEDECILLDKIMDNFFKAHGDLVYEAGLKAMGVECEF